MYPGVYFPIHPGVYHPMYTLVYTAPVYHPIHPWVYHGAYPHPWSYSAVSTLCSVARRRGSGLYSEINMGRREPLRRQVLLPV